MHNLSPCCMPMSLRNVCTMLSSLIHCCPEMHLCQIIRNVHLSISYHTVLIVRTNEEKFLCFLFLLDDNNLVFTYDCLSGFGLSYLPTSQDPYNIHRHTDTSNSPTVQYPMEQTQTHLTHPLYSTLWYRHF